MSILTQIAGNDQQIAGSILLLASRLEERSNEAFSSFNLSWLYFQAIGKCKRPCLMDPLPEKAGQLLMPEPKMSTSRAKLSGAKSDGFKKKNQVELLMLLFPNGNQSVSHVVYSRFVGNYFSIPDMNSRR